MTAPERIWASPEHSDEDKYGGFWIAAKVVPSVEYVRADLHEEAERRAATLAAERDGWKDAYDRAQRLRASDLERLAAEKEAVERERDDNAAALREFIRDLDTLAAEKGALEARAARMEKAGDRLSVAAQTTGGTAGRDEGLVAAITGWQIARAALTDTREGDARAKGHAWYDSVCREGELMLDVAARLGMTVAQVSAIRQGRAPIPREGETR